ncbi:MAG: glycosyltransferase family 2 protein, partial [Patescibacteria group bacterium]
MKISFIIVSWNVCELLERCLRSIGATSYEVPHEVIVVDNDSQDGSADMVARMFPQVKLFRNKENRGFAAACNQGISAGSGSYIFFINPDAELDSHALTRMIAYMDAHPDVGICAPQIRNADGSIQRSIQRFPTPLSQLGVLFKIRKIAPWFLRRYYADDFEYGRDEQDVEQPDGAALFVRRSALRKIGVFDEQFFLWFDEVDLCRRMRNAGFRIVYLNRARVIHQAGKSFAQKGFLEKQQIFFTSCARYLKKHCGFPGFLAALIMHSAIGFFALLDAKRFIFFAPIPQPASSVISPLSRHNKHLFLYALFLIIASELLSLA